MTREEAYGLLEKPVLEASDSFAVLSLIHKILNEHKGERGMAELSRSLCERAEASDGFSRTDMCMIYLTAVKAYGYSDYPWRAKPYASAAKDLLSSGLEGFHGDFVAERFCDLGGFYLSCMDVKSALLCFDSAHKAAQSAEWRGLSLINLIDCRTRLGETYDCPYTDAQLKEEFKDRYQAINRSLRGEGFFIKRDPVEHTEEFQRIADEVCEAVYARLGPSGSREYEFEYDRVFKEECRARGVEWNPID